MILRPRESLLQAHLGELVDILLSLITDENDFQREQASAAEETARRLDVKLRVTFAKNDAVGQSQQILEAIQAAPANRPQGILVEPTGGTGMQIGRASCRERV